MPDANGNFKGTGWTRAFGDAWDRAFGGAAPQRPALEHHPLSDLRICCGGLGPCTTCPCVPHEPTPEVDEPWDDGERADDQGARDGYNPAW